MINYPTAQERADKLYFRLFEVQDDTPIESIIQQFIEETERDTLERVAQLSQSKAKEEHETSVSGKNEIFRIAHESRSVALFQLAQDIRALKQVSHV